MHRATRRYPVLPSIESLCRGRAEVIIMRSSRLLIAFETHRDPHREAYSPPSFRLYGHSPFTPETSQSGADVLDGSKDPRFAAIIRSTPSTPNYTALHWFDTAASCESTYLDRPVLWPYRPPGVILDIRCRGPPE